ncbi:MAG: hypothetical protein KBD94_11175 [Pyrinomonadaceae bacterium]|nr:hypothetical protein [Pyrinomonadaceae bacterium]
MELEFDKEIDAILRRGRGELGAAAAVTSGHVDADMIAAFVENALPDKAKRLYTEHFADCGGCRKLLTQSILMNQTAAMEAAGAAEIVGAPLAPWYRGLFRTPNLALTMGALVLTFSGVLGYLVLQNLSSPNATVSQVADQRTANYPYSTGSGATANTTANTAMTANSSANTVSAPINTPPPGVANTGVGPSFSIESDDRFVGGQPEAAKPAEKPLDLMTAQPKPPPPPPVPAAREEPSTLSGVALDSVVTSESKDEDAKIADKKKIAAFDRDRRDLPASPAKSGPARAAGPVQMQSNQVNTQSFEMPVTRTVSGRTFENKDGVWYDRKYTGQATINVRRATDEFTKLDSGLRKIAKELNGVVVVVWKNKAYRIQ